MPRRTSGDFTLKRDGVERGIQADECFYLENEPKVRNQREIDLERYPPPDLGIEVEVTATVISRLPLYAKLRIPEVWRFDGERIEVLQLQSDGQYTVVPRSRYFPQVPLAEVVKFLKENLHLGEAQMFRAFRAWVRDQIARGWPNDS